MKQAFFSIFSLYLLAPGGIGVSLTQVVVPGSSDLTRSETGEYTIFYEYEGVVNGTIYSTDQNISGLKVEIENKSTGFKLPLHSPQSTKHTIGSRSGRSILEFDIDQPGVYELVGYPNGSGPQVVLTIGIGILYKIISTMIIGIILSLGSAVSAIAIVVIVYRKRKEAERKIEEEAAAIRGKR